MLDIVGVKDGTAWVIAAIGWAVVLILVRMGLVGILKRWLPEFGKPSLRNSFIALGMFLALAVIPAAFGVGTYMRLRHLQARWIVEEAQALIDQEGKALDWLRKGKEEFPRNSQYAELALPLLEQLRSGGKYRLALSALRILDESQIARNADLGSLKLFLEGFHRDMEAAEVLGSEKQFQQRLDRLTALEMKYASSEEFQDLLLKAKDEARKERAAFETAIRDGQALLGVDPVRSQATLQAFLTNYPQGDRENGATRLRDKAAGIAQAQSEFKRLERQIQTRDPWLEDHLDSLLQLFQKFSGEDHSALSSLGPLKEQGQAWMKAISEQLALAEEDGKGGRLEQVVKRFDTIKMETGWDRKSCRQVESQMNLLVNARAGLEEISKSRTSAQDSMARGRYEAACQELEKAIEAYPKCDGTQGLLDLLKTAKEAYLSRARNPGSFNSLETSAVLGKNVGRPVALDISPSGRLGLLATVGKVWILRLGTGVARLHGSFQVEEGDVGQAAFLDDETVVLSQGKTLTALDLKGRILARTVYTSNILSMDVCPGAAIGIALERENLAVLTLRDGTLKESRLIPGKDLKAAAGSTGTPWPRFVKFGKDDSHLLAYVEFAEANLLPFLCSVAEGRLTACPVPEVVSVLGPPGPSGRLYAGSRYGRVFSLDLEHVSRHGLTGRDLRELPVIQPKTQEAGNSEDEVIALDVGRDADFGVVLQVHGRLTALQGESRVNTVERSYITRLAVHASGASVFVCKANGEIGFWKHHEQLR